MDFSDMLKQLRKTLLQRIRDRRLSVSELSEQIGFARSHVSNFLHNRKQLSIPAADLFLAASGLSAADLLIDSFRSGPSEKSSAVPLVSEAIAISQPVIHRAAVTSMLNIPVHLLDYESDQCLPARRAWTRFVAIRISPVDAVPMDPVIRPNAIVIIDRHNTSPPNQQDLHPAVFAISRGARLVLRHVVHSRGRLILRPSSLTHKLEMFDIEADVPLSRLIVGRAVYTLNHL
jgi:transcriptional regulator with XRE-family HTH domain